MHAVQLTRLAGLVPLLLAGTMLAPPSALAAATPCTALAGAFPNGATLPISQAIGYAGQGTDTPQVLAIEATDIPANSLLPNTLSPAVCDVTLAISSVGDPQKSQISTGALLPEGTYGTNSPAAWNGRYLGIGNGGFAGSVSSDYLLIGLIPEYVASGTTYAVSNTDMGDGFGTELSPWYNCNTLFCGSEEGVELYPEQKLGGLYGNAVAIDDFGYEATHLSALAMKAVIGQFFGSAPTYSYFHGCSTGGQSALMEAQRFPTDYDAILAGSPAWDRTHLHIASASLYETVYAPGDGSGILTTGALGVAHAAMLAQCAGTDGGLATDDFLMQPAQCTFDASAVSCSVVPNPVPCTPAAGTSCNCLGDNQVVSMNAAWRGAVTNKGETLYPGYERGVEDPNAGVLQEEEGVSEPLFDSLDYWGFGPEFTWQSLFKTTTQVSGILASRITALDDTAVGGGTMESQLNASSPDLSAFNAAGGKLILYAGYEDPLIPSASSIDYYNAVRFGDKANQSYKGDPNLGDYMKFYLAPGMWHCDGGPGANAFGNLSADYPPVPGFYEDDVLGALIRWRESGVAPKAITATKYVNDDPSQGIAFQRPLCPYPENAHIINPNLPNSPASWKCEHGAYVKSQEFAPAYGPQ